MSIAHKVGLSWATTVGIGACLCVLSIGRIAAQTNSPKSVALTADSCAHVSDGDIISLDWNPVFDPASAVTGVHHFVMSFARREEIGRAHV